MDIRVDGSRVSWTVVATLTSVTAVAVVAMLVGFREVAFLAAGALVGYLGKLNGAAPQQPRNDEDDAA